MNNSPFAATARHGLLRRATVTLAAGALSLVGALAMAQNGANAKDPTITVKAPRVIHRSVGSGGLTVEQLSLTRKVSFADLNLDTAEGKAALHERIRASARAACRQLESAYPSRLWIDDVQTCVHNALLTWMPEVHAVAGVVRD